MRSATTLRRPLLYRDFVEQASQAYIYALQNNNEDVSSMVGLYAKISRMRVLPSAKVIERADLVMKLIVDTYLAPNKSLGELRELMISGKLDVLRDFSEACRIELGHVRAPSDQIELRSSLQAQRRIQRRPA